MSARALAWAVALGLSAPATALAQRECVEGPTVYQGAFDADLIEVLARRGLSCAHVRLRQDIWSGLDDATRRGTPARTLLEAWDALINLYRARGIEVILVVGADAMGRSTHELRDPVMRERYASFFTRVVQRYVRQVKAFELADQGNRPPPAGVSGASALPPQDLAALALLTRQTWERDGVGSLCNRHQVVFGGVHFDGSSGASAYLREVYVAGLGVDGAGGIWTDYRERNGRLPFDVVSVRSFPPWNPILAVENQGQDAASHAAEAVGDVLERFEGSPAARPIWITAAGFPSNGTMTENTRQRGWMQGFVDTLERRDLRVPLSLASWYAFLDPPWDRGGWGFFDDGVYDEAHPHIAFLDFANDILRNRPIPDARLQWLDPPLRLAPGEVRPVHLRITNASGERDGGVWAPDASLRVGAAPSCPDAEEVNQVRWTGFPSGGHSGAGAVEAWVDVHLETPLHPNGSTTVTWSITAPTAPERYKLSARLIWGEHQWFGQNATTWVEVVAPDASTDASLDAVADVAADATLDDTAPALDASRVADASTMDAAPSPRQDSGGCGCVVPRATAPAASAWWLSLAFACAFARRRRR